MHVQTVSEFPGSKRRQLCAHCHCIDYLKDAVSESAIHFTDCQHKPSNSSLITKVPFMVMTETYQKTKKAPSPFLGEVLTWWQTWLESIS